MSTVGSHSMSGREKEGMECMLRKRERERERKREKERERVCRCICSLARLLLSKINFPQIYNLFFDRVDYSYTVCITEFNVILFQKIKVLN